MTIRSGALVMALCGMCALVASGASAQLPSKLRQSEHAWKSMDECKRQAWKQYPDYTKEGSAKRDQAAKQCLSASNLPPVAPQPPAGSGSTRPKSER